MGYVIEVKPSTESITNADLIKATGNLLNNAISAINTGKKSEDRALISLNYVSNGNHLFTASTDLEIEFNTQSLWYNYSRKFKNCMINLLSNWELNSPNYLI